MRLSAKIHAMETAANVAAKPTLIQFAPALSGAVVLAAPLPPLSGGDVTLSWIGVRGTYYSVMYTDARGAKAQWKLLPDAVNVRGLATGEPIVVMDRVPASQPRYYRLVQDAKPLAP